MEHRCAQRKKTDMHVQYVTFDEMVHLGRIKDLSDLGARIITAEDIPEYGSIIEVMLPGPGIAPTARSRARGFVTWVRNHAFGLIWITEDAASRLFGGNEPRSVAS